MADVHSSNKEFYTGGRSVSGVGDEAVWFPSMNTLLVLGGNHTLPVYAAFGDPFMIATDPARRIVARM